MASELDGPRVGPLAGGAAGSLVVLLHGYGSNGEDLIGLAPYWREALPHTAFIAPNAPQRCPGAPGGYQWWGIASLERSDRAAGVAQAGPIVDAFLDAELARHNLTDDKLALVGFSQGTMVALHVGPRRAKPVAGIVGYSGMLADETAPAGRPPVLLIHGDADPMIPITAYHRTLAALTDMGFDVAGHVSPGMGHSIDAAGLQLGGAFLARVLGEAAAGG